MLQEQTIDDLSTAKCDKSYIFIGILSSKPIIAIEFFHPTPRRESLWGLGYFERFRKESEDRQRLLSGCPQMSGCLEDSWEMMWFEYTCRCRHVNLPGKLFWEDCNFANFATWKIKAVFRWCHDAFISPSRTLTHRSDVQSRAKCLFHLCLQPQRQWITTPPIDR